MEKSLRLPDDRPRRIAYDLSNPVRNKRVSWRSMADKERALLPGPVGEEKPISYFHMSPWLSARNFLVYPELKLDQEDRRGNYQKNCSFQQDKGTPCRRRHIYGWFS